LFTKDEPRWVENIDQKISARSLTLVTFAVVSTTWTRVNDVTAVIFSKNLFNLPKLYCAVKHLVKQSASYFILTDEHLIKLNAFNLI